MKNSSLDRRIKKTLLFIEKVIAKKNAKILDLSTPNKLADAMRKKGYNVENLEESIDLDYNYSCVKNKSFEIVTAFEILEHLVNPFSVIKNIEAPYLIASIPLSLWFSKAYWNKKDPRDRHYHEFEVRQFDMLLEKAGWKIKRKEKWKNPSYKIGVRPLLRHFVNRYYIVFCTR